MRVCLCVRACVGPRLPLLHMPPTPPHPVCVCVCVCVCVRVCVCPQARFKYPPHWVPLPMLYEAMQYVDPVTQLPRGYLRMSAQPLLASVLFTLDVRSSQWQLASGWLRSTGPQLLSQAAAQSPAPSVESTLDSLLGSLPTVALDTFMMVRQNYITQLGNGNGGNGVTAAASANNSTAMHGANGGNGGAAASTNSTASTMPSVVSHGAGATGAASHGAAGAATHVCGSQTAEQGVIEACQPTGARAQVLHELRMLPLFAVSILRYTHMHTHTHILTHTHELRMLPLFAVTADKQSCG